MALRSIWQFTEWSVQASCTPMFNKQFAPGFHSDLMTVRGHVEVRTIYSNEVSDLNLNNLCFHKQSLGL